MQLVNSHEVVVGSVESRNFMSKINDNFALSTGENVYINFFPSTKFKLLFSLSRQLVDDLLCTFGSPNYSRTTRLL